MHGMYEHRKCSGMGGVSVTGHVSVQTQEM